MQVFGAWLEPTPANQTQHQHAGQTFHETFSFYRGSTVKNLRTESNCHQLSTVKLWYITKSLIVFTPEIVRYMKKDLDRTKRHYSKHVSPVPWVFVISRFNCKKLEVKFFYTFESVLYPKEIFKNKIMGCEATGYQPRSILSSRSIKKKYREWVPVTVSIM